MSDYNCDSSQKKRHPVLKCGHRPNTELVLKNKQFRKREHWWENVSLQLTTGFTYLSPGRLALRRTAAFSRCLNCVNAFWLVFPSVRPHKSKSEHWWQPPNRALDDIIQVNSMKKAKAAVVISEPCLWHSLDSLMEFIGSCWVRASLEVGHPQRRARVFVFLILSWRMSSMKTRDLTGIPKGSGQTDLLVFTNFNQTYFFFHMIDQCACLKNKNVSTFMQTQLS